MNEVDIEKALDSQLGVVQQKVNDAYELGKAAGRNEAIKEVSEKILETYLQCGQAGQVFGINDVRRVLDEMEGEKHD